MIKRSKDLRVGDLVYLFGGHYIVDCKSISYGGFWLCGIDDCHAKYLPKDERLISVYAHRRRD